MCAHPGTHNPATQALIVAWIQSTLTLRSYLASLELPIAIADPTDPEGLEIIADDMARAHHVLNEAPIPAQLADQLRRPTALLLEALTHVGELMAQEHEEGADCVLPGWEVEATLLMVRHANSMLNQAGRAGREQ
ncbi:hypothetical protein [Nocardiopsis alba]|uniref:hypothetical protein n=1 Tax=Nocardiopsis alba TaxID=53437 RepID=UPI0033A4A77C